MLDLGSVAQKKENVGRNADASIDVKALKEKVAKIILKTRNWKQNQDANPELST